MARIYDSATIKPERTETWSEFEERGVSLFGIADTTRMSVKGAPNGMSVANYVESSSDWERDARPLQHECRCQPEEFANQGRFDANSLV